MRLLVPLFLFLALPALAETPMTGAEFESRVLGKTLSYSSGPGAPYGVEKYLAGRRVIWSFLDGQCEEGTWYEEDGNICFVYDFEPDPQCWAVFADGDGLRAIFMNDPGTSVLYEIGDGSADLVCSGYGV